MLMLRNLPFDDDFMGTIKTGNDILSPMHLLVFALLRWTEPDY